MKRILDVGCGAGNLLNYFAKRNRKALFYGVDIEESIIRRAEKNKFSNREKFVISDGKKLPFDDNFFDEVYCHEVLEHVKDIDSVLSEIKRVLKNGGKLQVTVPIEKSEKILIKYNKDYPKQIGHVRFFSEEKLKKILKDEKFLIEKYMTRNSIEHLYWKHVFKNGGRIVNQLGEVDKKAKKWMRISSLALSRELSYNIDQTKDEKYKIIMRSFIIFRPLIWLLDSVLINKKQIAIAKNEK